MQIITYRRSLASNRLHIARHVVPALHRLVAKVVR